MQFLVLFSALTLLLYCDALTEENTCAEIDYSEATHLRSLLDLLGDQGNYEVHCGEFLEKYKPPSSGHALIFLPHVSGISDRLVGMATSFVLALATDRMFRLSNMPELNDMATAFDMPGANFSVHTTDGFIISSLRENGMEGDTRGKVYPERGNIALVNGIGNSEYLLSPEFRKMALNRRTKELFLSTNRGLTVRAFEVKSYRKKLSEYGLTPSNAFGCVLGYFLKPKPEIFAPLRPIVQKMASPESRNLRISIHIRTADSVLIHGSSVDLSSYLTYFSCAKEVERILLKDAPKGSRATWFLFSDSLSLRRQAAKKYRGKVVTAVDVPVEHSAKEMICPFQNCVSPSGFSLSLAEWWLVGEADAVVATLQSGFGKSASMRSFRMHNTYFTFPGNTNSCVIPSNTYRSPKFLGEFLAGI